MDSINAKSYLSNLTAPGAPLRFYLKPDGTTNVTFEELCRRVAEKASVVFANAKYTLEIMNQVIIDLLRKNCRIHTGLFTAALGIGGSVGSIGEQPNKLTNPVHAVLTPEGSIVDVLKAIVVRNISAVVAAIINEVQEAGCLVLNKLTTPNAEVVINGACIAIDTTATDEGVWLCDKTTGTVVKTATIVSTDAARCVCKFATLPSNGQYRLVLATRNGDSSMDVVTKDRLVTVEVAAE